MSSYSLELMTDPVISKKCGHTFDSKSIEGWLSKHSACPCCHTPMTKDDLVTNYSLKNAIEYLKKQETNKTNN